MTKHYVTFYSPGTFTSEESTHEIDSWDVKTATLKAKNIFERYNAKPYGFRFSTGTRADHEIDYRITSRSPMFFLGGKIETLEEVKARATSNDRILIANMEGNGYNRIITNTNSWKITLPLKDEDIVLPWNS